MNQAALTESEKRERKLEFLREVCDNLRTQDNRGTALPIFLVREKVTDWGIDEGYTDSFLWVDEDESERVGSAEQESLEAEFMRTRDVPDGYRRVGVRFRYKTVQPFLTEAGAERYIANNRHNLSEPQIYAGSGYRNVEWELVREWLPQLRALLESNGAVSRFYSRRWERLHRLLKEESAPQVFERACAIMANGSADVTEAIGAVRADSDGKLLCIEALLDAHGDGDAATLVQGLRDVLGLERPNREEVG